MIKLTVTDQQDQVHEIDAPPGDRLMEVLREYDWGVAAICGGMCSCGTCHVYLDEPWRDAFPPIDSDEQDLLEMLEFNDTGSRLSCQLRLTDAHEGLSLKLAPDE